MLCRNIRSLSCLALVGLYWWLHPNGISTSVVASLLFSLPASEQPESISAARVHLANGQHALEAKKFQEAKAQLELAVREDPKLAEGYLALGILELQEGETTAAIERFRKVIELAPDSFQGHYHLAMASLREQKFQEGALELERAVNIDPSHADALYNLGVVLLELGL